MNNKLLIGGIAVVIIALGAFFVIQAFYEQPQPVETPLTTVLPYGTAVLQIGSHAVFPDVTLIPLSIIEDSRCPSDVQCIQAGTVRMQMNVVTRTGTSTHTITLKDAFTIDSVHIAFTDASPATLSQTTITPDRYRLTVAVTRETTPVSGGTPPGKCYVGGCSSQLCTDQPDAISTCEYTATYACYKTATCQQQSSGKCGWTMTAELSACLSTYQNGI